MSNHPNRDKRVLLDLVDQHAGGDFIRELLSWALHKVMEAEVNEITGAGKGERSPDGCQRCSGLPKREFRGDLSNYQIRTLGKLYQIQAI